MGLVPSREGIHPVSLRLSHYSSVKSPMARAAIYVLCCAMSIHAQSAGERWWEHVKFLADDRLEGRDTGSEGHRLAAQYAADQFKRVGLKPAGTIALVSAGTVRYPPD